MKFSTATLMTLLVTATIIGCNKKKQDDPTGPVLDNVLTISSKTATSFTVTWNAATDDTTTADQLLYKLVYSTNDNLTTAADAEANGTVKLDWTANTLTASFTGLTHSTNYYLAVLVKDADANITLAGSTVTTLCTGKRIFLTASANANFGGKSGADNLCNTAAGTAAGTYKAMLADNTGYAGGTGVPPTTVRQACDGSHNCISSTLYEYDWVFATNKTYCTSDYATKVGTTGSTYKTLDVPVGGVLSATPVNLFTGFSMYWNNSVGSNCSNWSSTSGTYVGGNSSYGYGNAVGTGFIAQNTFPSCASAGAIVCVEQ